MVYKEKSSTVLLLNGYSNKGTPNGLLLFHVSLHCTTLIREVSSSHSCQIRETATTHQWAEIRNLEYSTQNRMFISPPLFKAQGSMRKREQKEDKR